MAVASTVTVNITAETAKFENGLKKAKKTGKGFSDALAKSFKVAAAATAGLGIALTALTKQSLATVDSQRKVARTLGTTQRVFAGLSLAAGISGVAVGSFEKALKKQLKAVVDANDGLLTQKKAFDRLGLATADLIRMPVEEQFKSIVTALNDVENQTLKVGIASDIFGAKNADLLNVLELGAEGLDKYIKKVDELGVALTDKQTGNIEEANDAILVMKTAFTGLGNQIAARVAPTIIVVAEKIESLTSSVTDAIPKWTAWAASIFGVNRELTNLTLADLAAELNQIQKDTGALVDERAGLQAFSDKFRKPPAGTQMVIDKLSEKIETLRLRYVAAKEAQTKLLETGELTTPDSVGLGGDDNLTGDMDAIKFQRDFDAAIRATAKPLEALHLKLAAIRDQLTTNPLWSPELAGRQASAAVDAYLKELDRVDKASTALVDKQKADFESASAAVATPSEELQERLNKIREDLETNPFWTPEIAGRQAGAAVDAYLEEMKRLKDESDDLFKDMTEFQKRSFSNMQDILGQYLFDPWESGLDGMFKSFVDMLRKMVAQIVATKILEYLFGFLGNASGTIPVVGTPAAVASGAPAAIGGNRAGGVPLLVGERGPEMFTPGATGAIRPLGAMSFESNTTIQGGNALDIATLIPILEENNRKVKGEMLDAFDRGSYA